MAFLDKINQVATTIETKTNDTIEITKLNSKIRTENTAAIEELIKIGEIYYKQYAATGEIAPEALPFCQAAKGHYDAIAEAQAEIE
ncbi:MAG: hypothetical protein HUJ75_05445, partial [Parasporobacterium sp.]|nr:hypothetical protein [Parasporobacterium sp.]